ncbi:hypothetical protein EMIT0P100_160020 [Pseudomonas sp. IT-P100]
MAAFLIGKYVPGAIEAIRGEVISLCTFLICAPQYRTYRIPTGFFLCKGCIQSLRRPFTICIRP